MGCTINMSKNEMTDTAKNIVGIQVEALRKQQGLRQKELVKLLGDNGFQISTSGLSKLENQTRRVTDVELIILADVLGVTIDALLDKQ